MTDSFESRVFGENPFPPGTTAHDYFAMASRKAAEEYALLVGRLDLDDPRMVVRLSQSYFDIVAKYMLPFVDDYRAADKFERLLNSVRSNIVANVVARAPKLRSEVEAQLVTAQARWLSEALATARSSQDESSADVAGDRSTVELPQETTPWESLSIEFLSDHKIQLRVAERVIGAANYAEAGFGDRRGRGSVKETRAWKLLIAFAAKGRLPRPLSPQERTKFERRVVEIRKGLRTFLAGQGLTMPADDPLPLCDGEYTPRFKIFTTTAFRH